MSHRRALETGTPELGSWKITLVLSKAGDACQEEPVNAKSHYCSVLHKTHGIRTARNFWNNFFK